MTRFADKDFAARLSSMGDEAEFTFISEYPKGCVRWGLDRPPVVVSKLPPFIRFAPDYLTTDGFIEVGSVWRERVLKLKVEKHLNLMRWNNEHPTRMFVWDSIEDRFTYLTMPQLTGGIEHASIARFREGTPYWAIPIDKLGAEWVQRSPSNQSS